MLKSGLLGFGRVFPGSAQRLGARGREPVAAPVLRPRLSVVGGFCVRAYYRFEGKRL